MTHLDMTFVRARFPAFAVPALADKAFFENAGGSYACAPVIESRLRGHLRRARELPDALIARGLAVDLVEESVVHACDPGFRSFRNWNRPADLP